MSPRRANKIPVKNSPGTSSRPLEFGIWVKPVPITSGAPLLVLGDRNERVAELQGMLAEFGYGLEINSHFDTPTHDVVAAFQRHFRPERADGIYDNSTMETLQALLRLRRSSTD